MSSYLSAMLVAAMRWIVGGAVATAFEGSVRRGSPRQTDHRWTMLGIAVASLGDALVSGAHGLLCATTNHVSKDDLGSLRVHLG